MQTGTPAFPLQAGVKGMTMVVVGTSRLQTFSSLNKGSEDIGQRKGPKSSPLWSWAHSAHGWNSEPPPRRRRQSWRERKPPASQGAHAQSAQLSSQKAATIQRSRGHSAQEPAGAPGGPGQGLRGAGARRAPGEREPGVQRAARPETGSPGDALPGGRPLETLQPPGHCFDTPNENTGTGDGTGDDLPAPLPPPNN